LDNAYADIHTSFEMNPDNSFSWRNLGAYYLKTNRLAEALAHFEKAETIDPKTELINFYLGQTHKSMGNQDKAIYYLNKSQELKEYNDSTIE